MAGKVKSKAGEPASLWIKRIRQWKTLFEDAMTDPEMPRMDFRDAISCKLPWLVPGAADRRSSAEQVNVYWFKRAHDWYQAKCHDDDPQIRVRRTGGGEEAIFADLTETITQRVMDESGANRESKFVTTDCMWFGISFKWYRIDVLPTLESVQQGSKGAGDITDEALMGQHVPHAMHDHDTVAEALRGVVDSPDTGPTLPDEQVMNLEVAAAQHKAMADDEEDLPEIAWTPEKGSLVAEWSPPGWTAWSGTVTDVARSPWLARGFVMGLEDVKASSMFRPSAVKKLRAQPISRDDVARSILEQGAVELDQERLNAYDGACVWIWEIWDRRNKARHYICEQLDEYLERDEAYPYRDRKGEIGIPGFYPCEWTYHQLPPRDHPKRAFAQPVLGPGWPQQVEVVKFRSAMLSAAKRSARVFVYHNMADAKKVEALASGKDMAGVNAPEGVDIQDVIHFPPIPPVSADWVNEYAMLESDFERNVGITPTNMTGSSGEDTATGVAVQNEAQQTLTGDFIRSAEAGYARGCTVACALVRLAYPPEKMATLIDEEYLKPEEPSESNPEGLSMFDRWRQRPVAGDRFLVRFSGRAAKESPVRVQQIMQMVQLAKEDLDPNYGVPNIRSDYLIDEAFREAGLGEPIRYTETEKLDMVAKRAALMAPPPGEEQGGSSNGPPSPPRPGKSAGAPTEGNLAGQVQRVGPRPNGVRS